MGLYRLIQECDILGVKASLFTDKNYSLYKNFFGGVLSITVFLLIFSGTIFFIREFVNREQTNLIAGFVDDLKIINENFNQMPLMFRLSGDRGSLYPEGYYFIKAEFNEYDAAISSTQNTTFLKLEECSFEKNLKINEVLFQSYVDSANDYYCIDWEDIKFNLTGSYGASTKFSYISIYFYDCYHEENPFPETCVDKELVKTGLMESYIDLVTLNNNINHQTRTPNDEVLYKARIPVSNSVFKRIWLYYQAVSYITDNGFLFKEISEEKFFKISGYNIDLDIRVGFPFVYLTIVNNYEKLTYIRSHMKAPTLIANIGGIIKGLTLIGSILNYAISKNLNDLELMNTLYTNESLLKIYKVDKMVSKSSLKNVRSYAQEVNYDFDGKLKEFNNKYIKDVRGFDENSKKNNHHVNYDKLKQESIRDSESLSRHDKISMNSSNKNTRDIKSNVNNVYRNIHDDTTQKELINNNNINNNFDALNNINNNANNGVLVNKQIHIKDYSKQKYIVNNYIRNNNNY